MKGSVKTTPGKVTRALPAATVVLVRQHSGEFQVYLLKRSDQSRFMAGNFVFPGGVVEAHDRDAEFWRQCTDQCLMDTASRPGAEMPFVDALAYRITAIRETFEEAGALFIQEGSHRASEFEQTCELRNNQVLEKGWLKHKVRRNGWVLESSALKRLAHWITPALMPRRYDTRFFLAAVPSGQVCRPDNREMTHGTWVSPMQGLEANLSGAMPLSPPTLVTLHQLLTFRSLKHALGAVEQAAWGPAMEPYMISTDKGPVILEPWDPQFGQANIKINTDELKNGLVPAGAPFSRLWNDRGVWRTVTINV